MREHVESKGAANNFELNPKEIQAQTRNMSDADFKAKLDVILKLKRRKELPVLLMELETLQVQGCQCYF